jgi:hypothetical protein
MKNDQMENVKEKIERLGEICGAASMMKIGEELKNEQEIIINYLKVMNVIEIGIDGRGFYFTDEKYTDLFLEYRDNF